MASLCLLGAGDRNGTAGNASIVGFISQALVEEPHDLEELVLGDAPVVVGVNGEQVVLHFLLRPSQLFGHAEQLGTLDVAIAIKIKESKDLFIQQGIVVAGHLHVQRRVLALVSSHAPVSNDHLI